MPSASTLPPTHFSPSSGADWPAACLISRRRVLRFDLQAAVTPDPRIAVSRFRAAGAKSFQGGAKTAALGLFLHFLIAFIWAMIYYLASRQIAFLTESPVIAGLLYGEFVWVMMTLRGGAALSHPSLAAQNDPASIITGPIGHHVSRRPTDCAGGTPLGANEIAQSPQNRALGLNSGALPACPFTLGYSLITAKYRYFNGLASLNWPNWVS